MKYEHLIVEKRDDHIAIVKLNRPEKLNSLSRALMEEIIQVTEDFHKDIETRVVIFAGAGKHFSAGADLTENRQPTTVLGTLRELQIGPRMVEKLHAMEQITIAAINGGAFGGGCCIVTALDFRIGAEDCMAGFPESKLGMSLSWKSIPLAVHLIGPTYAKEMIILGNNIPAEKLLKWGFLSEIVPKDKLLDRAIEMAQKYASMPPIPAQMSKKTINKISSALDSSIMHMDSDEYLLTAKTEDIKEGISAFFEKRKGNFKGN
jgi:enoyl-CoA hydratase/carnithine racemase